MAGQNPRLPQDSRRGPCDRPPSHGRGVTQGIYRCQTDRPAVLFKDRQATLAAEYLTTPSLPGTRGVEVEGCRTRAHEGGDPCVSTIPQHLPAELYVNTGWHHPILDGP